MGIRDRFGFTRRGQAVQTVGRQNPVGGWQGYLPVQPTEYRLYDAMREGVPVIDAALDKIVRLTGGFSVECSSGRHQGEVDRFTREVGVGASGQGLRRFTEQYLHSLITYGSAVGEMIPHPEGDGVAALYNTRLSDVRLRVGRSPLEAVVCATSDGIAFAPVPYPDLVLFTALNPPPGEVQGVSLLRGLPFVTGVLMQIFHCVGTNFERLGNLRYAVTYKPGSSGLDRANAKDIAQGIAREWGAAMDGSAVKDFVAVGDVDVKVIGADVQMLDIQVPVRQLLEQVVAKLGIPPFMLGLHWSSTERMSTQQADILTSELESYRAMLAGPLTNICRMHLALKGLGGSVRIHWDDINLQDEVEAANARLLNAQALQLERQLDTPAQG